MAQRHISVNGKAVSDYIQVIMPCKPIIKNCFREALREIKIKC